MRREWTLALLAACATERAAAPSRQPGAARAAAQVRDAELIEEIREHVEKRWGRGLASSIEFVPLADVAVSRIEAEEHSPRVSVKWVYVSEWYQFLVATAEGETAEVVRVEGETTDAHLGRPSHEPYLPSTSPYGAWATRGTISRADFDRLARKVALLLQARIPDPGRSFIEGPRAVVRLRGAIDVPWPLTCSITSQPEDLLRGFLAAGLVLEEVERWNLAAVKDPDTIAAHLLEGEGAELSSWQWDARVEVLGLLGCASAVPVLLKRKGSEVQVALTRIRVLRECNGAVDAPSSLVDLAAGDDWTLSEWAETLLKGRFPADYRGLLYTRFESRERSVRETALERLFAYDSSDLTLAQRARGDPDPKMRLRVAELFDDRDLRRSLALDRTIGIEVRLRATGLYDDAVLNGVFLPWEGSAPPLDLPLPVETRVRAAGQVPDAELLIALARDPTMPRQGRCAAIDALTGPRRVWCSAWGLGWSSWVTEWKGIAPPRDPPGDRQAAGAALVALLDDPEPRIRSRSAAGLADIGYVEAVPALLAKLRSALAEPRDLTLAADIAVALGFLGAKEAVEPLDEAMKGSTSPYFEACAGFALAQIRDGRVRPILEREALEKRRWPSTRKLALGNLDVHKSVRRAEAQAIVEAEGERAAHLLADRFSAEELREFAAEGVADASILERALALKEGRG